ncbi:MAG: glycosyltransferase family 4 protein [Emcibacteraceae bacterium]|nr:glycosyltransferase family 4 protein [Emcibacteraceae bacterium]
MKITHFISSPASGGAEVYVKDLSIAMSKLGHEVHILFLSNADEIVRDISYEAKFLTDLSDNNVEYSFIGNKARKNPFLGIKKLRKHIKHFEPAVLHCHLYYALIFSLFSLGVKVVYTHHNIKLKLPSFFYKMFDLRVSSYIGICHSCTNMISAITNKGVVNINNAVAESRIKPKKVYVDNSVPEILMVGHLSEQKNYKLILDVVLLLKNKDFVVKVAGEGPEFRSFSTTVSENGLDSKIKLLGNVSNVSDYMHDADIFAMTSSWEGLPISLIEATLTGLPTIVTNVGGCAEVAHETLNGFVVESFEAPVYADKLSALIDSFELRKNLSINALFYSGKFKLSAAVDSHLTLYNSI